MFVRLRSFYVCTLSHTQTRALAHTHAHTCAVFAFCHTRRVESSLFGNLSDVIFEKCRHMSLAFLFLAIAGVNSLHERSAAFASSPSCFLSSLFPARFTTPRVVARLLRFLARIPVSSGVFAVFQVISSRLRQPSFVVRSSVVLLELESSHFAYCVHFEVSLPVPSFRSLYLLARWRYNFGRGKQINTCREKETSFSHIYVERIKQLQYLDYL